jgi:hypothetical protein
MSSEEEKLGPVEEQVIKAMATGIVSDIRTTNKEMIRRNRTRRNRKNKIAAESRRRNRANR